MEINLGSVLTIVSMLISVALAYGALSGRILVLEEATTQHSLQMNSIEQKVDTVSTKLTDLAFEQGREAQKLEDERREKQ